jgi:hypothetical protein
LRARGVRAVVDVSNDCGEVGEIVRQQGMRYLRLSPGRTGSPHPEELHIVTSWVLQRMQDTGSVLLHDSRAAGNDALLACAVLVKRGSSLDKAQARVRSVTQASLTASQGDLLRQFMAQRALASARA